MVQCSAPKRKGPLGRPRLRWKDQMKKDLKRLEPGTGWHILAMDRGKKWQK